MVGATGPNTGKTEFVCRVIEKQRGRRPITGVKVAAVKPGERCQRGRDDCNICSHLEGDFEITRETDPGLSKDTSRMLAAGADKVFFLKVRSDALEKGLHEVLKLIPEDSMVACESNSLRKVMEPGLFIIIKNAGERSVKKSCADVIEYADKITEFDNSGRDFDPGRVHIKNNSWIIREKASAIVLAGGKSSRMGREKPLMTIGEKPLVEVIISQLEGFFDEIILGASNGKKYRFLNCRIAEDKKRGMGPLMGIMSSLSASSSDVNFITACDIPEMNIPFIKKMIRHSEDADVVMPVKNQKYEPLFAIYKKNVAGLIQKILDNKGRRITELFDYARVKTIPFENTGWYYNINTKNNYSDYIEKKGKSK